METVTQGSGPRRRDAGVPEATKAPTSLGEAAVVAVVAATGSAPRNQALGDRETAADSWVTSGLCRVDQSIVAADPRGGGVMLMGSCGRTTLVFGQTGRIRHGETLPSFRTSPRLLAAAPVKPRPPS